jgi:class 3 adenylate cyclase
MPLITPEGYAIGTLCIMDFVPRELGFEQRETLRRLAQQLIGLLEYRRRVIELDQAMAELDDAHAALAAEKASSEELLHRILPEPIAEELKANGKVAPRFFPVSTVLLADIKGFTEFTKGAEPAMLIGMLDRYFAGFDEIMARRGLEKLKTIGDAYLAVAGLPKSDRLHAIKACLAALDMLGVVAALRAERQRLRLPFFELRIGLHTGPVIAGVVGRNRFTYDVWGEGVNLAAIMEANGEAGRINLSESVYHHAAPYFEVTGRGPIEGKNGESIPMYFLDRLKPEFSEDPAGRLPNRRFFSTIDPVAGVFRTG